jgi:hypothetical protein
MNNVQTITSVLEICISNKTVPSTTIWSKSKTVKMQGNQWSCLSTLDLESDQNWSNTVKQPRSHCYHIMWSYSDTKWASSKPK